LLEQLGDDRLERIEFAGAVSGLRSQRFQILGIRAAADSHICRAILRKDHFSTKWRRCDSLG
jgi:hypothetical protein